MSDNQTPNQPVTPDDDPYAYQDYTEGELLELAQGTLQALIVGTVRFLTEQGGSVDAWVAALARTFGAAWDTGDQWAADELMDVVLTNLRALGGTVVSAEMGEDSASARIRDFPNRELCAELGIEPDAVLGYNDVVGGIAAERGLAWSWRRDGDETVYAVTRAVTSS